MPRLEDVHKSIGVALGRAKKTLLTTHITPDGDGLGSALALLRFLRGRGQQARILNCSSMPGDLRWLPRDGEYGVWHPERHRDTLRQADVIVATDLGGASRLGRMEHPVRQAKATRIVIDHHIYENDIFDLSLIRPEASSSAELTYDLIKALGGPIDLEIAEPLYVGLVSDTGSFAYSATSPRAHRLAAELLEAGVDPHKVWKKLNCQVSQKKMRFLGDRLANLEFSDDGRIVWTRIDLAALKSFDIPARDAFEVVNHLLKVKGVEIGLLFMEISPTRTKLSLRSSGNADVCAIARKHGGGGHRFAAGCTIDGTPRDRAVEETLRAAERALADIPGAAAGGPR